MLMDDVDWLDTLAASTRSGNGVEGIAQRVE